ncbi:hypothetical protein KYY02_17110 [Streptomyces pimonensis]|uniref:Uncharacterized protein n=1 Tax=Streptomyces pimonensis TaxID=2860288 RepID=A0ABV4J0K6_9ACTN
MTITDLIPGLKGHGRRRAVDKVEELSEDVRSLLTFKMAADDFFALLTQDRDDVYACWDEERSKRHEAEEIVVQQLASIEALRAENDQLYAELLALKAAAANAGAVTVPPMVRPIDGPEDQATAPIDVRPLWAARDAGLLGPGDDTQPIEGI